MSRPKGTLHMLCGKIAAGKSTLSDELGKAENTVVISEDRWITQLYSGIPRSSENRLTESAGSIPVAW